MQTGAIIFIFRSIMDYKTVLMILPTVDIFSILREVGGCIVLIDFQQTVHFLYIAFRGVAEGHWTRAPGLGAPNRVIRVRQN